MARESRSVLSSHREHQLSADGAVFSDAAAGDDRALLSGLVSDDSDRPAAVPRLYLLDFQFLSGGAEGIAAEKLGADLSLHAVRDGHRHRHFDPQRQGGARSALRGEKRI